MQKSLHHSRNLSRKARTNLTLGCGISILIVPHAASRTFAVGEPTILVGPLAK